jgi:hypothetical protein
MARTLGQLVLVLTVLLGLVNLPVNIFGTVLAYLSPQATGLATYDGMLFPRSSPDSYLPEPSGRVALGQSPTYLSIGGWLVGMVSVMGGTWLVWRQFRRRKNRVVSPHSTMAAYQAQALLYQTQIERVLKTTINPGDQAHRQQLAAQVKVWIAAIQALTRRISAWQEDDLIGRELTAVPLAIEALQAQLTPETDAALCRQLQQALTNRYNQLASLEELQHTTKQAELQIENTLSLLGLIYAQILAGQSTRQVANYSRLCAEVDEEVQRLQDRLEALREVKARRFTH